jgi:hypothetical protein
MQLSSFRRNATASALVAVLVAFATLHAGLAQSVNVTVNGSPVTLTPPPVERAGRVFVPLRGVFEHLGASVVYQSGQINATGNGRTISLRIGSTSATVDGQQQALDVAPFIIGASTYVPLRFVAQALGATVNYDGSNRIVAIALASGSAVVTPVPTAPAPARSAVRLRDQQPPDGAVVAARRPTISAEFGRRVDPNTVKVTLDGLDISDATTRSDTGIVYAPPSPLQASQHAVVVTGKDTDGLPFERSWSFTSGTQAPKNLLVVSQPPDGSMVPNSFTVRGRTLPNARVHLVAGAIASAGGVFAFQTGSYAGDTIADSAGDFAQTVSLNTVSGGSIGLTVTSTDPITNDSAQVKLSLRAR